MNVTVTIAAVPELISTLNRICAVMEGSLTAPQKTTIADVITESPSTKSLNSIAEGMNITPELQSMRQPVQPMLQVPVQQQTSFVQSAAQIQQQPITPPAGLVPTASQTYTLDQLAVAATQLVDAGRRTELVSLLQSFGVQALTALPREQYGAFATQLRALGAKFDNLYVQKRNTEGSKI